MDNGNIAYPAMTAWGKGWDFVESLSWGWMMTAWNISLCQFSQCKQQDSLRAGNVDRSLMI